MSRSSSVRIPKYRRHPNGLAFVYHRSIASKDHRQYLGKHGTEESLRRYQQFLARLQAAQPTQTLMAIDPVPCVFELVLAYDEHARRHYARPNGQTAREYGEMKRALNLLLELYGDELAQDVGPKSLKRIREVMIDRDYARSHINHTISRIKRFFRWASSEELVPADHYHKLLSVAGLQKGELGARESKRVLPACPHAVQAILPYLSPVVRGMVQVQYLCGMRPGEVVMMRSCDIDRSGDIWWYRPASHKTEWRGQQLVKAIPRSAQSIVAEFLAGDGDYLFSPAAALGWSMDRVREARPRATPRYPSEARRTEKVKELRRRRIKRKQPGDHYTSRSYAKAVRAAFDRATADGLHLERFTPNQLRHAILSFVSEQLGQQAAQRYGGHAKLETTSIYVEVERRELERVARQLDAIWDV